MLYILELMIYGLYIFVKIQILELFFKNKLNYMSYILNKGCINHGNILFVL